MTEVKILKPNFLNQQEITEIKNKIFELKPFWVADYSNRDKFKPIKKYFLFPATYSNFKLKLDQISINNKIMYEHFEFYFSKIQNFLSNFFNLTVEYTKELQLPGFHIFGPGIPNKKISQLDLNFHKDHQSELLKFNNQEIYSFIIPIQLPKENNSGLIYIDNNEHKELIYSEGTFAIWPGNTLHSIKPFSLIGDDDFRITWQIHALKSKEKITLFW